MKNIYDTEEMAKIRAEAEIFRKNTSKILPPRVELPAELMELTANEPICVQQALSNLYFRGNIISPHSKDFPKKDDSIMLLAVNLHFLWAIKMFNAGLTWNHISGSHYDVKLLPWERLQSDFPDDAKFFTNYASRIVNLLSDYGFAIIA